METVPCSIVGHIYRAFHPYTLPDNVFALNSGRMAEVWMDEYKKHYYLHHPQAKTIDLGDLEKRRKIKKKLLCKPFYWYLKTVYPSKDLMQ